MQFFIICPTRSASTKKVNKHGAYNSAVIVAGFAVLAHEPGLLPAGVLRVEANPRLPRHIGRDERLKDAQRPAATDEGYGLARNVVRPKNAKNIWCAPLALTLSILWLLDLENGNNEILSQPALRGHQIQLPNLQTSLKKDKSHLNDENLAFLARNGSNAMSDLCKGSLT